MTYRLTPFLPDLHLQTPIDGSLPLAIVDAERLHAEKLLTEAKRFDSQSLPGCSGRRIPEPLPFTDLSMCLEPSADHVRVVDADDDDKDARQDEYEPNQRGADDDGALLLLADADLTCAAEDAA